MSEQAVKRCGTCAWFSHNSGHYVTHCKAAEAMPSVGKTQGVTEHHGSTCPVWTSLREGKTNG